MIPPVFAYRYNLDPFNNYNEEEIWAVLEKTYMKEPVCSPHDMKPSTFTILSVSIYVTLKK